MNKMMIPVLVSVLLLSACSTSEEAEIADVETSNIESGQSYDVTHPQSKEIHETNQSEKAEESVQSGEVDFSAGNESVTSTIRSLLDGSYTAIGDPTSFQMTYGPELQKFLNQSDNHIVVVNTLRKIDASDVEGGVQYSVELSVNTSLVLPNESMDAAAKRVHYYVSNNINSVESQIVTIIVKLDKNTRNLEKIG